MSQNPVYVLADDGLFYRNPRIGALDWFLCFDEDYAEIVVCGRRDAKPSAAAITALVILNINGIAHGKLSPAVKCSRVFPGEKKPRPAWCFSVMVLRPIPRELLGRAKGRRCEEITGNATRWTFGVMI